MSKIAAFYGRNKKTIAAVVGTLLAFATVVVASPASAITAAEWLSLAFGLAGSTGVYTATNVK